MSNKPTKNLPKNQPQVVEEERDPMLRALQKKVRNINKKLNEIAELSARKDLKPEQEEKISKKAQVVEEREKYQEMIEVYREIAAENEKLIRKNQIAELEDLAQIITYNEFGANLTPNLNQTIANLVKVLNTPSRELTIRQRVCQISEVLIQTANNSKLKASVKEYIEANLEKRLEVNEENTNAKEEKEEEIIVVSEDKQERQPKVENNTQFQTLVPEASNPVEQTIQAEPHVEANPAGAEIESVQGEEPKTENTDQKIGNESKNDQGQRNERRGRGRGGRGRGGRFNEEREGKPYKKPTFKPKYEEQKPQENGIESDESEDSEPKARDFKREEVKDLINDGFIVVGKPKPKGRDQKQFHQHEHGKKFHPHHQKHDY